MSENLAELVEIGDLDELLRATDRLCDAREWLVLVDLRDRCRRAVERNISEQEIRAAGATAEVIENYPDDKYSPSALLLGFTAAGRALRRQAS